MTSPGESTATGHRLGLQLRQWLASDPERLRSGTAIANRLIDALGADDSLRGPIRDLSSRPQLLQALHSQGASQQAAVTSLRQQLAETYAPAVLLQLLALLDAATGVRGENRDGPVMEAADEPLPAGRAGILDSRTERRAEDNAERKDSDANSHANSGEDPGLEPPCRPPGWQPLLHAVAPGIAFGGMLLVILAMVSLLLSHVQALCTRASSDYRAGAVAACVLFSWITSFWFPLN